MFVLVFFAKINTICNLRCGKEQKRKSKSDLQILSVLSQTAGRRLFWFNFTFIEFLAILDDTIDTCHIKFHV